MAELKAGGCVLNGPPDYMDPEVVKYCLEVSRRRLDAALRMPPPPDETPKQTAARCAAAAAEYLNNIWNPHVPASPETAALLTILRDLVEEGTLDEPFVLNLNDKDRYSAPLAIVYLDWAAVGFPGATP